MNSADKIKISLLKKVITTNNLDTDKITSIVDATLKGILIFFFVFVVLAFVDASVVIHTGVTNDSGFETIWGSFTLIVFSLFILLLAVLWKFRKYGTPHIKRGIEAAVKAAQPHLDKLQQAQQLPQTGQGIPQTRTPQPTPQSIPQSIPQSTPQTIPSSRKVQSAIDNEFL
jgi:hypothetical protein